MTVFPTSAALLSFLVHLLCWFFCQSTGRYAETYSLSDVIQFVCHLFDFFSIIFFVFDLFLTELNSQHLSGFEISFFIRENVLLSVKVLKLFNTKETSGFRNRLGGLTRWVSSDASLKSRFLNQILNYWVCFLDTAVYVLNLGSQTHTYTFKNV